ncbi:MAG: hypothetical protein WA655_14665 [Candidatus Korobacteraceae bacterium]
MGLPGTISSGLATGLLIPVGFFAYEFSVERKASYVTLTPFKRTRDPRTGEIIGGNEEVSFDPRHGHYMKCAEVLITLASASLVFIPTLHVSSLLPKLAFSMVLLGFTVVYGLLFMALLTYFYEMFLFDPASFTAFRSSLVFTLGFSAFLCFALAYIWLSIVTGTAIGNGSLLVSNH